MCQLTHEMWVEKERCRSGPQGEACGASDASHGSSRRDVCLREVLVEGVSGQPETGSPRTWKLPNPEEVLLACVFP